jgi:hypothetical protein
MLTIVSAIALTTDETYKVYNLCTMQKSGCVEKICMYLAFLTRQTDEERWW